MSNDMEVVFYSEDESFVAAIGSELFKLKPFYTLHCHIADPIHRGALCTDDLSCSSNPPIAR